MSTNAGDRGAGWRRCRRRGVFTPLAEAQRKHYLGIAAGSGITPLLSLIKTTLRRESRSRFTLFYGNRRRQDILFAEELAALKSSYPARLAVHHFLSREAQQPELFHGRLDRTRLQRALAALLPRGLVDEAFVCGPNDMIDQACACLESAGLAASRIHCERFGEPVRGAAPPPAREEENPAASVTVIIDGQQRQLALRAGERILAAAAAGSTYPLAKVGYAAPAEPGAVRRGVHGQEFRPGTRRGGTRLRARLSGAATNPASGAQF